MSADASSRHAAASCADPIIRAIVLGDARTRTELGRTLGLAASTVSTRVRTLLDLGELVEGEAVASGGGRPQRVLRVPDRAGCIVALDLGAGHVRAAALTMTGARSVSRELPFEMRQTPVDAIDQLAAIASELAGDRLRAVGVSVPGPVSAGVMDSPARMPGWDGWDVRTMLSDRLGVPVVVENDADTLAYGEAAQRPHHRSVVAVKAGTSLGGGFVQRGRIHRGSSGVAGDLAHNRVAAAGNRPCNCGNVGCLETVATGAALVEELRSHGYDVAHAVDVVQLARQADPIAMTAVRSAGAMVGEVLAPIVNFLNPDGVYVGGLLSGLEPFIASVRTQIYSRCHPLATRRIEVAASALGDDAVVDAIGRIAIAFTQKERS